MLTEVSRATFAYWNYQPGNNDPNGYYDHPTLTTVGDTICVADLRRLKYVEPGTGSQFICWTGVRLFTPDNTYIFDFATLPMKYTGLALWLYEDGGLLVAAVLIRTPPSTFLMGFFKINPLTGAFVEESYIPAPMPYDYASETNGGMPVVVEETGAGLSLRTRLLLNPPASGWFEALRGLDGQWTVTAEVDGDGAALYLPVTAHGWTLDLVTSLESAPQVTLSDTDGGVVVPPPADTSNYFGSYTRASMDRRHPASSSFVLSTGEFRDETVTGVYDVCVFSSDPPPEPADPPSWWQGRLPLPGDNDYGWHPDWGSGTLTPGIIPEIKDGTVVITNPADPDNPWAWATLPPGAGQNDWLQFYVDRDWVQILYGGRVVLVWRMPPEVYQHFLEGGASMGFYNSYTKQWQAEAPPGWPPPQAGPLTGWAYLVDSRHWVGESGGGVLSHGVRIDADDVLVFPGQYALVGQALQDDVIASAPIKYIAGRVADPVVLSRDDAELVWDAGYGQYLYPVEEPA